MKLLKIEPLIAILISTASQAEYVDQCDTVEKIAYSVMSARQKGQTPTEFLKLVNRTNPSIAELDTHLSLMFRAWLVPVEDSAKEKLIKVRVFSKNQHDKCWTGQA